MVKGYITYASRAYPCSLGVTGILSHNPTKAPAY